MCIQRQQGEPGVPTVVAVEIHRVLQRGNSQLARDARNRACNSLLFLFGKPGITVFERGIDFIAGGRGGICEGDDTSNSSGL